MKPVTLSGRRVRLEPLSPEHHADLCRVGLEPSLWARTTIRVRTPAEMTAYIQMALDSQASGHTLPFVIVLQDSNTIVGTTRFHSIVPVHRRCEIGFTWIGQPWQRQGINLESKYLLLLHAFEEWQYGRVEFKADAENEPSRRALLALGAVEEGVMRRYMVSEYLGVRDLALYSIVAADWPRVKARLLTRLVR